MNTNTLKSTDIDRLARKRADAKMGWYIHTLVYISVNLMLVLLSMVRGRHWAAFPVMGWGLGLAIHGVMVFFVTGGTGLHERLMKRERARLASEREAW